MVDTILKLIEPPARQQDAKGIWRTSSETSKDVFAQVSSVNRNEFFSGGQAGMQPEYQFRVFSGEYSGQSICEYNGIRYAIYRTYHVPGTDYIELYVQREAGVRNAPQTINTESGGDNSGA